MCILVLFISTSSYFPFFSLLFFLFFFAFVISFFVFFSLYTFLTFSFFFSLITSAFLFLSVLLYLLFRFPSFFLSLFHEYSKSNGACDANRQEKGMTYVGVIRYVIVDPTYGNNRVFVYTRCRHVACMWKTLKLDTNTKRHVGWHLFKIIVQLFDKPD